ncbi:MAG: 4,5-DOPA dioxygenase extradiol [Rhodanobacteraceae bacterium]
MTTAHPGRMPVLFIGHGNPMNAIEHNAFRQSWQELGRKLPKPKAVLCVSAHWETRGVYLTGSGNPETIHDFHGFPKALFDVQYPAPGDPALAHSIKDQITSLDARLDPERGLDHGAWSVLMAMYPEADVAVVQLSLDTGRPGAFHYALAQELKPLRDDGVLVLGSGNIVHNLSVFSFHNPSPLDWAVQYDEEIKKRILERDHEALMSYETVAPNAKLAVPTPEHYYPLLYTLALQDAGEPVGFFNSTVWSSISMTSVLIGEAR